MNDGGVLDRIARLLEADTDYIGRGIALAVLALVALLAVQTL